MKCVGILVGIKILAYLGEGEFVLILTNWSFTWKTSTQARPGKQVSCVRFREVAPPRLRLSNIMNRLKKSSVVASAFKLLVGPVLESSKSGIGFGRTRGPYDLSQVNTGVSAGSPNPRNASSSLPLWSTLPAVAYGAPFSHLFTELKISPIEVHISAIELEISPIQLKISAIELQISPNRPIWRYLQFIWRYLQFIWRYLQIRPIWRYLQFIWRYLQIDKCDTISAPRRKNSCEMIQLNGLIKSCRPSI